MTSLALALAVPAALASQGPPFGAKGLSITAAIGGTAILSDEVFDEVDPGGGLLLGLGWGFTPGLMLFLEGSGASISANGEQLILGHDDLGLRYLFTAPTYEFTAYVEGAFTGLAGTWDDVSFSDARSEDVEMSGRGFSLGGGLYYFFSRVTALNVGLRWTTGEFTTVKVGRLSLNGFDAEARSTRLNVGLSWFFGSSR